MPKHERSQVEFAGKIAVVTGAAQGIGRAIAEEMYARGCGVVLVDRNADKLMQTAEAMTPSRSADTPAVDALVADLAEPSQIERLAGEIAKLAPTIDILVNNAAIEFDLPFKEVTYDIFDRVIAVNLRAPFLLTRELAAAFAPAGGAIVNISSIHADHAFANAIPYACSKAGLIALTRNLALELAPRKIRVNAVCPGYIDTAMWDEWLLSSPDPEALARQTAELHPLGRRGVPRDVADAVAYLVSPQACWITGTHLVIDGGLTIRAHP